jgi:hypothetical protein
VQRNVASNFRAFSLVLIALLHAGLCSGKTDTMNEERQRLAAGDWGGKHVRMDVSQNGASLEFDCANGSIKQPVMLDSAGRFSAKGEFAREGFGPRREEEEPKRQPALYSGTVKDRVMTLTITLTETKEEVGTFTLTQGVRGRLWKCR